jgi:hypothetical protein
LSERGEFVWPKDEVGRRNRARQLLGLSLVSILDGEVHRAEDEIFNTHNAPWADPKRVGEDEKRRRAALASLTPDQKEVVLELAQKLGEGLLFGICAELDQFCGGRLEMSVFGADDERPDEVLRIQPGSALDMHQEFYVWLEEFSRIYGK